MSIVLTSQGISFLHAGTEFLRTKKGVENSFESPDSINAIDWSLKTKNKEVFEYIKGLIKMRREHPAFRMNDVEKIKTNIVFIDKGQKDVVMYMVNGQNVKDTWKKILVILNGSKERSIGTPTEGQWKTAILNNKFNMLTFENKAISIEPYSCTILHQE
jgi:pullulanase